MAIERKPIQTQWEDKYINKVNQIADIEALRAEALMLQQGNSQQTLPEPAMSPDQVDYPLVAIPSGPGGSLVRAGTVLNHPEHSSYTIGEGDFTLPERVSPSYVSSDGHVTIMKGVRGEVSRARVLHDQARKAAGHMAISTDMYYFHDGIIGENAFAPDFIPVLVALYERGAGFWKEKRIPLTSAFRWWKMKSNGKTTKFSFHECGCAIDVNATGERRYQIADVAWEMGLRGVFVGKTFVHIDAGPDGGGFAYNGVPKYRGPESH